MRRRTFTATLFAAGAATAASCGAHHTLGRWRLLDSSSIRRGIPRPSDQVAHRVHHRKGGIAGRVVEHKACMVSDTYRLDRVRVIDMGTMGGT